jgi:hypothetical protein
MRPRRFSSVASAVVLVSLIGATAAPADTVETLGSIGAIAVPASGLLAAAVHKDGEGARQLAESYGSTMALVYTLKPVVDRQRPVIAGGAIGIASNLVFTHKLSRVAVQPAVVPRGAGLTLSLQW